MRAEIHGLRRDGRAGVDVGEAVLRQPVEEITAVEASPARRARVDTAGDTVRPVRDNGDRLGYVSVRAADTDSAVSLCERLINGDVHIQVEAPVTGPVLEPAF